MITENETMSKFEIMDGAPVRGSVTYAKPIKTRFDIPWLCVVGSASNFTPCICCDAGESIPVRLFLSSFPLVPTQRDVCNKFSVRCDIDVFHHPKNTQVICANHVASVTAFISTWYWLTKRTGGEFSSVS